MDYTSYRSYYPGTETEAIESAYEYGEINTLTNFDVLVHDIQMKDTDEILEFH